MTPKLSIAVDPIFLHVLDLLDRIDRNESLSANDERVRIRALIDQAEAIVGAGGEWELVKYALVAWIDEVLVDAPWEGRDWWSNNVLEMEFFNTRLRHEQFFVKAQEASRLSRRDALEVYYVCVILGFRGLYLEPEMSSYLIQTNGLPPDLNTWAKQMAMSIRLGQGRPPLAGPVREIRGAAPLSTRGGIVWSWLAVALLFAVVLVGSTLFWSAG